MTASATPLNYSFMSQNQELVVHYVVVDVVEKRC